MSDNTDRFFVYIASASFCTFFLVERAVLPRLYGTCSLTYRRMSARDRARVCNSTTSCLHALVISMMVLHTFLVDENLKPDAIRYHSYYAHVDVSVLLGYFLSDTLAMIQMKYHTLVLHHILAIIPAVLNVFIQPFCLYFGHLMLLVEVSNIFMNLRNTLKYLGYDRSSPVFAANDAMFAVTLFLFRVVPMPLFWYQVLVTCIPHPDYWRPQFAAMRFTMCFAAAAIQAMNLRWFFMIVKYVRTVFYPKSHVE